MHGFGQSLHVVDLGEVGGDEVGRPATLGHGRTGRQPTGRIATANDDVGPARRRAGLPPLARYPWRLR